MKSKVFFTDVKAKGPKQSKIIKLQNLFDAAGFKECIKPNDLTAIKIHFGEIGNEGYVNPVFARQIVDKIKSCGGNPFLTDSNTLYSGKRANAVDHLATATLHGFGYSVVNAPLVIADGLNGSDEILIEIHKKHFEKVRIAGAIESADSMIVVSHFKGHGMAGFGGAIKNLAMGCATPKGKQDQHATRPQVNKKKCIGCKQCIGVCSVSAISIEENKACIDSAKCIGCGECMSHCPVQAFYLDWDTELTDFTEKLVEYAYGSVISKKGKVGYINFLTNITPDCDCCQWSDTVVVQDIGILASLDPVALDKASLDLVNQAFAKQQENNKEADVFKNIHSNTRGDIQLSYGEMVGLGCVDYELITI